MNVTEFIKSYKDSSQEEILKNVRFLDYFKNHNFIDYCLDYRGNKTFIPSFFPYKEHGVFGLGYFLYTEEKTVVITDLDVSKFISVDKFIATFIVSVTIINDNSLKIVYFSKILRDKIKKEYISLQVEDFEILSYFCKEKEEESVEECVVLEEPIGEWLERDEHSSFSLFDSTYNELDSDFKFAVGVSEKEILNRIKEIIISDEFRELTLDKMLNFLFSMLDNEESRKIVADVIYVVVASKHNSLLSLVEIEKSIKKLM